MYELIKILPNVELTTPIENDFIAIVNYKDERAKEIFKNFPHLKQLINSFKDQFSNKIFPSLLLVNRKFKKPSDEAIVAFRNILAISTIAKGFEHRFTNTFTAYPLYSEYFDFYPLTTSKTNEVIYNTPSVIGTVDNLNRFEGQSYPFLFDTGTVSTDYYCPLLSPLNEIWIKRFISNNGKNWNTTKLFRSLEMAYQACSIPIKNNHSMYDHGVSASLWISAFEILSHPGGNGRVDIWSVLKLLNNYNWLDNKSIKKKSFHLRNNKIHLIQKLYFELYNLRNDFLHGNKVTANNIRPFKKSKNKSFIYYALLIYKIALLSFLKNLDNPQVDKNTSIEDKLLQRLYRSDYEGPIREIFLSTRR